MQITSTLLTVGNQVLLSTIATAFRHTEGRSESKGPSKMKERIPPMIEHNTQKNKLIKAVRI